jgi:hypothetical protein
MSPKGLAAAERGKIERSLCRALRQYCGEDDPIDVGVWSPLTGLYGASKVKSSFAIILMKLKSKRFGSFKFKVSGHEAIPSVVD